MITIKRILLSLLLIVSALCLVPSARAETINDFRTDVRVNTDGSINVKETVLYDFGTAGIHHGIFRDIPTHKTNQDGKRYRLDVNVTGVTDESNIPYAYSTAYTGSQDDLQLKIGSANILVSGVKTYVISYKVNGALTYFSEHDELYWNMTGTSWNVPIERASYEVTLPAAVPSVKVNQKCYTGSYGSTQSDCQMDTANGILSGSTVSPLGIGQGLTAVIGFPPGFVAHVEPKEVVSFWDTTLGKITSAILAILAIIWYLILPFSVPFVWWRWGRDPQGATGPVSAWFDPPQDKAGHRLTPGETGMLIDESVDMRDIFATIIHLAQRGYLKIVEKDKNDYYFIRQKDYHSDTTLADYERKLLMGIFPGSTTESKIKSTNIAPEVTAASDMLYVNMTKAGFFPHNPNTVRTVWYVLAGVVLCTGNIFLGAELFIFGRIMPRKTLFGVQQANVGKSLKNFLSTQERQLEFQAKNQMFFEKLLPYAIAFGVEKIWADRFKDISLHNPDWYQPYNNHAFTTAYFLSSMNSSFSNFRSSATPTRSSSGFSSGFSGGGFSGGGGGGGGGGSW